jgi:hypothetical protein
VRHGTAIPPHLDARSRRLSACGHPQFRPNQECCIVADGALSIRLPLSAPSSSGADATPTGVKQPRVPGCAETSRLASKRLQLCLLSAYAAR